MCELSNGYSLIFIVLFGDFNLGFLFSFCQNLRVLIYH